MSNQASRSDIVANGIRTLRRSRGWSRDHLAERCARLGYPALTAPALANIETGRRDARGRRRRDVTVDELFVFAEAFGTPVDALLTEAACERCCGSPPTGFACLSCGANSST